MMIVRSASFLGRTWKDSGCLGPPKIGLTEGCEPVEGGMTLGPVVRWNGTLALEFAGGLETAAAVTWGVGAGRWGRAGVGALL